MDKQEMRARLTGHVLQERKSRAWTLYAPRTVTKLLPIDFEGAYPFAKARPRVEKASFSYDSNYAYSITWTPGSLMLTGDIGEMVLTHYHAMRTFEETVAWLRGSDASYLLDKSDKRRKFDAEESARQAIRMLNEPVIEAIMGRLDWRTNKRQPYGVRHELRAWRKERESYEGFGGDEAWMAERPTGGFEPFEKIKMTRLEWASLIRPKITDYWNIPEHWMPWVQAWMACPYSAFIDAIPDGNDPSDVLKAEVRAEIRDWLRDLTDPREFVDAMHRMDLHDNYGVENWSWHDFFQIEALKRWADMVWDLEFAPVAALAEEAA